jgi:hypothetical protein
MEKKPCRFGKANSIFIQIKQERILHTQLVYLLVVVELATFFDPDYM